MLDFILNALVYILAIYGLFEIIKTIVYIMELTTGTFLWSYEGFFLNFEGRIALKPAILFGLLVLLAVKAIHPKLKEIQEKYNTAVHNVIFCIVTVLFVADLLARFWLGSNM